MNAAYSIQCKVNAYGQLVTENFSPIVGVSEHSRLVNGLYRRCTPDGKPIHDLAFLCELEGEHESDQDDISGPDSEMSTGYSE
jgi:hypothetical protein